MRQLLVGSGWFIWMSAAHFPLDVPFECPMWCVIAGGFPLHLKSICVHTLLSADIFVVISKHSMHPTRPAMKRIPRIKESYPFRTHLSHQRQCSSIQLSYGFGFDHSWAHKLIQKKNLLLNGQKKGCIYWNLIESDLFNIAVPILSMPWICRGIGVATSLSSRCASNWSTWVAFVERFSYISCSLSLILY